jgi:hypothetical protein
MHGQAQTRGCLHENTSLCMLRVERDTQDNIAKGDPAGSAIHKTIWQGAFGTRKPTHPGGTHQAS